jgi:hypothetical protein
MHVACQVCAFVTRGALFSVTVAGRLRTLRLTLRHHPKAQRGESKPHDQGGCHVCEPR